MFLHDVKKKTDYVSFKILHTVLNTLISNNLFNIQWFTKLHLSLVTTLKLKITTNRLAIKYQNTQVASPLVKC